MRQAVSDSNSGNGRRNRAIIGLIAMIIGALTTTVGFSSGTSLAYEGPVQMRSTSASNNATYWGAGCTKLDEPGGRTWTADADYSIVVLKAAQIDWVYYNVEAGDVLSVGQQAISHFIFCPPTPTTTTTTLPETTTTTTTVPETTTTTTTVPETTTTTTVPETTTTTTTTVPETTTTTTTTVPETTTTTTTTVPETTTTTTTVPETTTTTVPETTTTTVPDSTTTTVPETTTTTVPDSTTTTVPETTTTVPDSTTTTVVDQGGGTTTTTTPATTTTVVGSGSATTTVVTELPKTGSDSTRSMVLLGVGLMLFGLTLVLGSRRPQNI